MWEVWGKGRGGAGAQEIYCLSPACPESSQHHGKPSLLVPTPSGLTREPAAAHRPSHSRPGAGDLRGALSLGLGGSGAHVGDVTFLPFCAVSTGSALPVLDGLAPQSRAARGLGPLRATIGSLDPRA